ncbi:MAG: hypothetical protein KAW94_00530 [Candidatus Thorarchaeota archaeon]|nr:hypothetical protein [Candidatus Thorarchaeota archaeon]MCK4739952.1 hypothetical protein [Candidatus Thorarchaeota archaeon]
MTEEKKYPRAKPAKLVTVRSLSADTENPVKIMGIVVEAQPGIALVQDILDDVDNAGSIWAMVEGTLEVAQKYILIGDVTEKKASDDNELRLSVSLSYSIDSLDIALYKETLGLEEKVDQALSR